MNQKFHVSFLAMVAMHAFFFSFVFNNQEINNIQSYSSPTHPAEKNPGLCYSLNLPLQAGSLFAEKTQQIIINPSSLFKKLSLRYLFLSLDDLFFHAAHHHRSDTSEYLRFRTSFEFICELQI